MKLILMLVLAVAFTGCSSLKPGCFIQDKLSAVATDIVASKLQCANAFAVKADMDQLVSKIGLCKESQTGPIADAVCPLLVNTVVDKISGAAIPAEWGCTATDAKAAVKDALTSACKMIPVNAE